MGFQQKNIDMSKLKRLFESYLKSSYRTSPVRSPFSHGNYYPEGYVDSGQNGWIELTELYNTTYRSFHESEVFDRVLYNEPLNVMVMDLKEGLDENNREGFEHVDTNCVVQLGLKTARGYGKDYRFLDMSIPGAGKVAVSKEQGKTIVEEPMKALREIRPEFMRNFGEVPVETSGGEETVNEVLTEETARKVHRLVTEELDKLLSEKRKHVFDFSRSQNKKIRKQLRKRQLNEELSKIEDALIDVCVRQLREGGRFSNVEKSVIKETVS